MQPAGTMCTNISWQHSTTVSPAPAGHLLPAWGALALLCRMLCYIGLVEDTGGALPRLTFVSQPSPNFLCSYSLPKVFFPAATWRRQCPPQGNSWLTAISKIPVTHFIQCSFPFLHAAFHRQCPPQGNSWLTAIPTAPGYLYPGCFLESLQHKCRLEYQCADGNLVLYRTDTGEALWASGATVPRDKVGRLELLVRRGAALLIRWGGWWWWSAGWSCR
jgi:hypothetical protein